MLHQHWRKHIFVNSQKNKIKELIKIGEESDIVDFKQQYYHDAKKSDFIKDIISFANASTIEDKYIIFGVSDDTREIVGISDAQIPDISDINQLIRNYCDPFIEIDIERVNIDSKNVAAIIIKRKNMSKPYVVAKDYAYNGKIHIHAGDIFIRKSANNFRALRSDIEEIYNTRLFVDILSVDNMIKIGMVEIAKTNNNFARIPIRLINNTDNSFVFVKAVIKWIYPNSQISTDIKYIEDDIRLFKHMLATIDKSPFVVSANSQNQKVLYSNVSEGFCKIVSENEALQQELKIEISLFDARGIEYNTSFCAENIIWE